MRGKSNEGADISVISSDMKITGACQTDGHVRVEGRIVGDVSARGFELAPTGEVEGDVESANGVTSSESFVIAGSVRGSVRAGRVEVLKGGSVSGGVVAGEAVIEGKVQGGLEASTRLALEASAEVEGDVLAHRLALKEGGQVNGTIRMGERAGKRKPAPSRST